MLTENRNDNSSVGKLCERGLGSLETKAIQDYCIIQNLFLTSDNLSNAVEFQRKFTGFYRMFRTTRANKAAFFDLFEIARSSNLDFQDCLVKLFEATSRVEASFVSKMVATMDTSKPVYDSLVCIALELRPRTLGTPEQLIRNRCEIYKTISAIINAFSESSFFPPIEARFKDKFPQFAPHLSHVKMIDFMLWEAGKQDQRLARSERPKPANGL